MGVVVAVLAGVQDSAEGLEGGLGDLGEDGGLVAWLVPEHFEVDGLEQAGFELGWQVGEDVAGEGEVAGYGDAPGA